MSIASYAEFIELTSPATQANGTELISHVFSTIENDGTENRKVIRISGRGFLATNITQGSVAAMLCFRAYPALQGDDPFPGVAEFDPWATGPKIGDTSYEGRPSPRPFGRHEMVFSNAGSTYQGLFQELSISTRAERLIRPGWKLACGLYLRSSKALAANAVRVALAPRVTVAG